MAWYVNQNGQVLGPLDDAQVVEWIQTGQALGGTICRVGSKEWVDVTTHAPFAAALRAVAPPPPIPTAAPLPKRRIFDPEKLTASNVFVIFGLSIGCVWAYVKCSASDQPKAATTEPKRPEHDKGTAWVMAKQFVKEKLKSPGSAEFGGLFSGDHQSSETQVQDLGGGSYVAKGWVDAQNAFGAKVRSDFVVKLKYVGRSEWQLDGPLAIEQRE